MAKADVVREEARKAEEKRRKKESLEEATKWRFEKYVTLGIPLTWVRQQWCLLGPKGEEIFLKFHVGAVSITIDGKRTDWALPKAIRGARACATLRKVLNGVRKVPVPGEVAPISTLILPRSQVQPRARVEETNRKVGETEAEFRGALASHGIKSGVSIHPNANGTARISLCAMTPKAFNALLDTLLDLQILESGRESDK